MIPTQSCLNATRSLGTSRSRRSGDHLQLLRTEGRSTALRAVLLIEAETIEIPAYPELGAKLIGSNYRQRSLRFGRGAFLLVYDPTREPIEILRVRHSRQIRVAK